MNSPEKLYKFYVANLREVEKAMERIARSIHDSISKEDESTTPSYMRLYAELLGEYLSNDLLWIDKRRNNL